MELSIHQQRTLKQMRKDIKDTQNRVAELEAILKKYHSSEPHDYGARRSNTTEQKKGFDFEF